MNSRRTKIGQFMYNLVVNGSRFLIKHKWLYYLLNFTWGLLANILGLLITIALIFCGKLPTIYQGCIKTTIKDNWGGFSLGVFYVRDKTSTNNVDYHEIGHSYQNAILGPLWLILVGVPSMTRYFYQVYIAPKLNKAVNAYDLIWFEGSATFIGGILNELN